MLFALATMVLMAAPTPTKTPVLVELFTSEGCSSCPPADDLLGELLAKQPVSGAEVVPLSLHVDYWNGLGWSDPFSAGEYSARQQGYSEAFGDDSVYTPEFVIDGGEHFAADRGRSLAAIEKAGKAPHAEVTVNAKPGALGWDVSVTVGKLPGGTASDVWLAVAEGPLRSHVRAGENRGRDLQHVAVTRKLLHLGTVPASGGRIAGPLMLDSSWNAAPLRLVAFVQGQRDRRVLGTGTFALLQARDATPAK